MKPVNSMVVIDDNEISNILVSKLIDYEGLTEDLNTFQHASDALQFLLEKIDKEPSSFPDIIFLDVNMPQMDGWEFLDEYEKLPKEITKGCLLFMLSSSISETDIEKAKFYFSVTDYVTKPITREVLKSIRETYFTETK